MIVPNRSGRDAAIRCKKVAAGNAKTGVVATGIGRAEVGLGAEHDVSNLIVSANLAAGDEGGASDIVAK